MAAEQRLVELGIDLPEPVSPAANYVRYQLTGNLLFISGTGPDAGQAKGKVDSEVSVDHPRALPASMAMAVSGAA